MIKIGIIPARMSSSRFPGKPMKMIHGIPMVGHCYKRAKMCDLLDDVYVATCDYEIHNYIESTGGKSVMTSNKHERASDRVSEALLKIEKEKEIKVDIVVLLQGDEPMTTPKMIELAVTPLLNDSKIVISNLYTNIKTLQEFEDPNEVKVVLDKDDYALYFSREPIPSRKKGFEEVPMFKQVCVIPFMRDFLLEYNSLDQTQLEKIESVDMMRVLENGKKIKMVYIDEENCSVDTLNDLNKVIELMKNDKLMHLYLQK